VLGAFTRGLHFWAAQAMYDLVILHLLRVILHGSYKRPREGNYLVGVVMFALHRGGDRPTAYRRARRAFWACLLVAVVLSGALSAATGPSAPRWPSPEWGVLLAVWSGWP
jgi:hypothetical protein